jgi:hypothetical protein
MSTSVEFMITSSSSCPLCSWCFSDASSLPAIGMSCVMRDGMESWSAIRRFDTVLQIHVPRGQCSVPFCARDSGPPKLQRTVVCVIVGGVRSSHEAPPAMRACVPKSGHRSYVHPVLGKVILHGESEPPSASVSQTSADEGASHDSSARRSEARICTPMAEGKDVDICAASYAGIAVAPSSAGCMMMTVEDEGPGATLSNATWPPRRMYCRDPISTPL